jgi:hypothetical protein
VTVNEPNGMIQISEEICDLGLYDRVFVIQKWKSIQSLCGLYEPSLAICDINVSIH